MEFISEFFSGFNLILIAAGIVVGIFGVIFGGSMFISVPLFSFLFPGATLGQIIGNIKLGSLVRGVGSTWQTRRDIDWGLCLMTSWPFVLGAILGAYLISNMSQLWLFPMIIIAILLTEYAEKINKIGITQEAYYLAAFASGVYAGFMGIGIALLLVALLRIRHPEDGKIAWVKIQARFLEFIIAVASISTHIYNDNIIFAMFFYWMIGSLIGGVIGGFLLSRMQGVSPAYQKVVLRLTYLFAILTASYALYSSWPEAQEFVEKLLAGSVRID